MKRLYNLISLGVLLTLFFCFIFKIYTLGDIHQIFTLTRFSTQVNSLIPDKPNDSSLEFTHNKNQTNTPAPEFEEIPGWKLIWHDEFNGNTINEQYWTLQKGGEIWGNNELQNYTDRPKNAFVSDGNLIIRGLKENYDGYHYTSARIVTKEKVDFQYGRIDIKAKFPSGKGLFPALWLLPTKDNYNSYQKNGEIDIVEILGNDPHMIYGVAHFSKGDEHRAYSKFRNGTDFSKDFHVYSIEWDVDSIKWSVDNLVYYTFDLDGTFDEKYNPFDKNFYLIMNLALGGDWPGSDFSGTVFPAEMKVDYVRYYTRSQ